MGCLAYATKREHRGAGRKKYILEYYPTYTEYMQLRIHEPEYLSLIFHYQAIVSKHHVSKQNHSFFFPVLSYLKGYGKRHVSSQTQSLRIRRPLCPSPEECPAGPGIAPPHGCTWSTSWRSPLSSHRGTVACPLCTWCLSGRIFPACRCSGRPNNAGLPHIRRCSSSIWGGLRSTTQGRSCCSISKGICK